MLAMMGIEVGERGCDLVDEVLVGLGLFGEGGCHGDCYGLVALHFLNKGREGGVAADDGLDALTNVGMEGLLKVEIFGYGGYPGLAISQRR